MVATLGYTIFPFDSSAAMPPRKVSSTPTGSFSSVVGKRTMQPSNSSIVARKVAWLAGEYLKTLHAMPALIMPFARGTVS